MAQMGWCNSLSDFLGQKTAADPVQEALGLRGWYTEGRIPIGAMEGTESQEPTRTKNPNGSGKFWGTCMCMVGLQRPTLCCCGHRARGEAGKLKTWGEHSVDSWAI